MKERLARTAQALLGRGPSPEWQRLEATQWLGAGDLAAIQERKLGRLLVHARDHVPYYAQLFRGRGIDPRNLALARDFSKIPVLTRDDVRRNFDSLVAADSRRRDRRRSESGGTTGMRTSFLNDRRALPMLRALVLRNKRWTGWEIGRKEAVLWSSFPDLTKHRRWHRRLCDELLLRRLFLSAAEMSDEVMRRYAQALDRYEPELITGYASALALLARFMRRNGLRLHPPRGIVSSAEALEEGDREEIESAFGARVFNRYGSREIGGIAQECEVHGGLHVNAEHVYLEVVDRAGNPCRPGETGEIVVTDLDNYVFPFIRYRIGDLGTAAHGPCPCGRGLPLLARVVGRSFDVITTPDGRYLCLTTYRFWIGDVRGIGGLQVIQHDLHTLELRIVADASFTEAERAKLEKRVRRHYGGPVAIRITPVNDIPAGESGKRLRVISRISPFAS